MIPIVTLRIDIAELENMIILVKEKLL